MFFSYQSEIQRRIDNFECGYVFSAYDFYDIANTDAINKTLSRLSESKQIKRITQGYYYMPQYSQIIKEYASPDINSLASAMARRFDWTISPCGDWAMNLLHLSTQVPSVWEFVSDGPNKIIDLEFCTLKFKKCANKDITGKSYITNLIIQAFKTIGKDNITGDIMLRLRDTVPLADMQRAMIETKNSTRWIHQNICEILEKYKND